MKKISGIYSIINTLNNLRYVGSSSNMTKRWNEHKYQLSKNTHRNRYLQNAWNKYGVYNFKFEILEIVENFTVELLEKQEQHWIDFYNSSDRQKGYNLRLKANTNLGMKRTLETKEKMRQKKLGKQFRLGTKHTQETIEKMRQSHAGFKHTAETKAKISKTTKGKSHPGHPNNRKGLLIVQFCPNGHNTFITGRYKSHKCKACVVVWNQRRGISK